MRTWKTEAPDFEFFFRCFKMAQEKWNISKNSHTQISYIPVQNHRKRTWKKLQNHSTTITTNEQTHQKDDKPTKSIQYKFVIKGPVSFIGTKE